MKPTVLSSRSNRKFSFALLAFAFVSGCVASTQAQVTRDWMNTNGGVFDIASNWSPTGAPGTLDTARFDLFTTTDIPVFFFQNESIKTLEVDNGKVALKGTGSSGTGPRRLDVQNVFVDSDRQLSLLHGVQNRSFHLAATNSFIVQGTMLVADGTRVTSPLRMIVDRPTGGEFALVHLAGENPDGETSTLSGQRVTVGNLGTGSMAVENGARADLEDVVLGSEPGSNGELLIQADSSTGVRSTVNILNSMLIGRFGNGSVELRDGGQLYVPISSLAFFDSGSAEVLVAGRQPSGNPSHWDSDVFSAFDANISIEGGALMTNRVTRLVNGEAEVTGLDSNWAISESLEVGGDDAGFVLNVGNAARLTSLDTQIAPEPGMIGTIAVSGLSGGSPGRFINDGDLVVGGNDVQAGGIGILDGLAFSRIEVGQSIKIWNDGIVNINSLSTVIADSIDNTNGGEFNFSGGTLQTNQFEGDLVQGGTLVPGGLEAGSTFILGDLTQQNGSKFILDIGGTAAGVNHDLVNLSGIAFVDGQIGVRLLNGFVPDPSDEFTVMAANNLLGFFINVFNGQRLDTVDGSGSFVVNYGIGSPFGEDRIVLTNFEPSAGLMVTPDSMTVIRGNLSSGSAVDLAESDNSDVSIRRATGDVQSRTTFEVTSTSPIANPGRMTVTLEGSVFARSAVTQTIELYNYDSNSWEQIDSRIAQRLSDMVAEVVVTGDVTRFVESGSNETMARVSYRSTSPRQSFTSNTDQFTWSIGS